ncbi:MAG: DUF3054 domain-containing protein [Anaerolineales bacterium]
MKKKNILIIGDVISLIILVTIGFATHGEQGVSFLPRMAAVFFPTVVAWFVLAPWFGLFDQQVIKEFKVFWRIPFAVLFAVPLALVVRGFILNTPVVPLFAAVFTTTTSLGLLVWRTIYKSIFKTEA